jgi:hypothetical protein
MRVKRPFMPFLVPLSLQTPVVTTITADNFTDIQFHKG